VDVVRKRYLSDKEGGEDVGEEKEECLNFEVVG
jgi:hypothetical protein